MPFVTDMVQRPRGTRDFIPTVMNRRLAFEKLLEKEASSHGFKRVQTPIFESLDLFTAKSGPGVVNQLYAFQDKSDRALTLRPELTAPVMRMISEEMRAHSKPMRLSYFGQCFRYEESKAGRYREFFQYGVELIGASGPLAEAEVVSLAINMLESSGLIDYEVRIGHVGILRDILVGLGLSTEGEPEAPVASAMRFLDKGDWDGLASLFANNGVESNALENLKKLAQLDGGIETLESARDILSALGVSHESLDELSHLLAAVSKLAPPPPSLKVNLCVARGLDYYTGMVFEVNVEELGGEGQVLGGGSYKLLHLFGLEDLDPSCGFGLGFDRVLIALEAQAKRSGRSEVVPGEYPAPSVLVLPFRIDSFEVLEIIRELRDLGHNVELDLRKKNIAKSVAWADKNGFSSVVIIGPQDLENNQCTVKNITSGEQKTVDLNSTSISTAL
ncbi:MAG: histidine--tRNA ligase [Euryarchaeota archaeon]|nr:histidine--tRNA ligase [Euryarchaeota archaeon]